MSAEYPAALWNWANPLPVALASLPQPIYLVGGSVRDLLLGRQAQGKQDFDLVTTEDPVIWAKPLARQLRTGFVVLDPERRIVRLVGQAWTLDIALQMGSSIEADLARRDFACNAMAIELHQLELHQIQLEKIQLHKLDPSLWIDPFGGHQDIQNQRIRMVDADNLTEDPLRLLRAYRQAAQLGFEIEPVTREAIRQRGSLLSQVAAERVRSELDGLLQTGSRGLAYLHQALADGVLQSWLPMPLCLTAAAAVHRQKLKLEQGFPRCGQTLQSALADQRPTFLMVLWAALLSGADSPVTDVAVIDIAVTDVTEILASLRYSRAEWQAASKWLEELPIFLDLAPDLGPVERYRWFQKLGSLMPGLVLLALGVGMSWEAAVPWLIHYEDPEDALAHPVPLLDGRILMQALGLTPGPQVGQLLTEVGEAQAAGRIQTQTEALDYARQQYASQKYARQE